MKKNFKKVIFLVIFLAILIIPYLVFAQTAAPADTSAPKALSNMGKVAETGGYKSVDETTISAIAGRVVNSVLGLLGMIFIILIIYGGYLWMTAQGNDSQVDKAKNILKNSIIGLMIVVSAYAIYNFVIVYLLA
jgi:hypothetical protein